MTQIVHTSYCTSPSAKGFERELQNMEKLGARSVLILASDHDDWQADQVDSSLLTTPLTIFGGVFPQIISGGKNLSSGTLFVGFACQVKAVCINHLSYGHTHIDEQLERGAKALTDSNNFLTLVDGLTTNIERFVECLYDKVGIDAVAVGGGAGSLDFIQKPCLFTNQGFIGNAAIIACLEKPIFQGLAHGWQELDGPYLVTRAYGNILQEINFRPAFEVYRESIESKSDKRFSDHDFFSIAKTFPLGIESVDGEILVRDPIQVEQNALICVGEVPENATVFLLMGEKNNLLNSAGEAAMHASNDKNESTTKSHSGFAILFDCISRALFLDDDFINEVEAIENNLNENTPLFGALTLGEIGTSPCGPIELLNKSTVIAVA